MLLHGSIRQLLLLQHPGAQPLRSHQGNDAFRRVSFPTAWTAWPVALRRVNEKWRRQIKEKVKRS
jgi:hypothetical protein